MRKLMLILGGLVALGGWGATPFSWTVSAPVASCVADASGAVTVTVNDDEWLPDWDTPGAPMLPRRVLLVAVPSGARWVGASFDADWETMQEKVHLAPQGAVARVGETPSAPTPDPAYYDTDLFPAEPVTAGAERLLSGVRVVPVAVTPFRWHPRTGLLERAKRLELRIEFADDRTASSQLLAPALAESVKAVVVNPEAVSTKRAGARLAAAPGANTRVDYLLLSPPDFVEDWNWYVEKRREVHPELTYLVKNTAEIYAEYPFGEGNECRNAAESIHAYLRANRSTMNFSYIVLGGAWLDAQNRQNRTTYFATGETMSLSNCVPGVYGYPRENWREIPSDMFYACLDMRYDQRYPWDENQDGVYIDQNNCSRNDLMPDVAVSRITLNPWTGNNSPYNRHTLLTNYVAKLARGEAKTFAGHFHYGVSADSTGSRRKRANRDRMYYNELEFYDGMPNMFDPVHSDWIEDNEKATRERFHGQFGKWRPVLSVQGMMSFTWTPGFANLSQAIDDYYNRDKDYGFVYSHGWAQGATHFQANRFATGRGLTLLNGSNGPCDTGYVDYYVTFQNRPTLAYNLGDSGVSSPVGGALCSINNTRWGWAGGSNGYDESMSYMMLNRSLVGFNAMGLTVGQSWLKGVVDYAKQGAPQNGSTSTWTLTEQICYGDPLVQLPKLENRYWAGATDGVWDTVTECWTNEQGTAVAYMAASNVNFAVAGDYHVQVTNLVGAMRVQVENAEANGTFTLDGAGKLRVMKSIDVTGGNLALAVEGGVGLEGIRFVGESGEVTFTGNHKFYVGGLVNVKGVNLNGSGVTLDEDNFAANTVAPLRFQGPGVDQMPGPNTFRTTEAGALNRFGPIALTNTWLKLVTVDAFGNGAPAAITLADSRLEIAANTGYQLAGFPEGLNLTATVAGNSMVTNSIGGLWTLKHTSTFNLESGANLTLAAEVKDANGKIVVNGAGTVHAVNASTLAGKVEIGAGTTLVLDEIPLAAVTSLTLAEGAKVILPDAKSGYWQILPVSSRLNCAENVEFAAASAPEQSIVGTPSPTGAFFKEGALTRWTEVDGHWSAAFAHLHPKVLFGDLEGEGSATVRVDLAVTPQFVSFANAETAYTFVSAAAEASIAFDSVIFNGDTTFALPVSASEYVEVLGGTVAFSQLVAPRVRFAAGSEWVLTGSHWTQVTLDEGAVLKARPDQSLDCNADTEIVFPTTGTIALDVSELTLTDTPQLLVKGVGHVWTHDDLARLRLVGQAAEFRIVNGALGVVRGENLKGPYALAWEGETTWNVDSWSANGEPFGANWRVRVTDHTAAISLKPSGVNAAVMRVDCDVVADSLTVEEFDQGFTLTAGAGSLDVATLDLQSAVGGAEVDLTTGAAAILCPTNDEGRIVLRRGGTGTVTLKSGTLVLHQWGEWTLPSGSQGTIQIVEPKGWQQFRVAYAGSGFVMGGVTFEVVTTAGVKVPGASFTLANGAVWCTPPGVRAEVTAGGHEWSELAWKDAFGNDASDVDWRAASSFTLIGVESGAYVTSTNGFAGVLDRVAAEGTVELRAALMWSPNQLPNSGGLVLGGGFKVKVDLSQTPNILNGAKLGLAADATLEVNHGGKTANAADQDWRGITGEGQIIHVNVPSGNWLAWPGNSTGAELSLMNGADVVLTERISTTNPLAVRNLSGDGSFRTDWGSGSDMRPVRTVQTKVTEYTGTLFEINRNRDSKLIVSSDAPTATEEKALILSRNAIASHQLEVETNGCVILTGGWRGAITVKGLLIVTNEAALANAQVTLVAPDGRKEVRETIPTPAAVSTEDPPAVSTVAPERIVPVVPVEDTTIRELTATVAAGTTTWRELEWMGTNGVAWTSGDWSVIDKVTVTGVDGARIVFDAADFTGVAKLLGGLVVEAHGKPPFTLDAGSVCKVETRFATAPTASGLLLRTATGFTPDASVEVTLRSATGASFNAPVAVTYGTDGYRLLWQNVNSPTKNHTFDGSTSASISQTSGIPENTNASYFVPSRNGKGFTGTVTDNGNNVLLDAPGRRSWTIHLVAKTPSNQGGIMFSFGYGAYSAKGICFIGDGPDRAALCVWRNWNAPIRLSAQVPFAREQYHAYAATYDGSKLRFYVDGELSGEVEDTEGWNDDKFGKLGFGKMCSGANPNGLANAPSCVIDDWRFYVDACLTSESVKYLASQFRPWPDTVTATAWEPNTKWNELVWEPEVEDWSTVLSARIEQGDPAATVICDEFGYTGPLALVGGAKLIATNTLPFKLASYPEGEIAFVLENVTTNAHLVNVVSDYVCDNADFAVTVTDRQGNLPQEPWLATQYSDQWYWLRLQNIEQPAFALTFDGSTGAGLDGVTKPALKDTDGSQFIASRSGQALTGRNPYFSSPLGTYSAWTMNVVAKLPTVANGIIFAYGNNSKGIALYSPSTDVVAVGAWNGGSKQSDLVRVNVANAQVQFHSYALVYVGSKLTLWVDGVEVASGACNGYPGNGNAQFFSVHGGGVGGFAVGTSGAVDDWRFFAEQLAPSGIQSLAAKFAPWPEYRVASVANGEMKWGDLEWSGEDATKPLLLRNDGGTLALDQEIEPSTALVVSGSALAVKVTGEGALRSNAGLTFLGGMQIDASGLNGEELAKCAVAGAPYSRWLVRGAYTGTAPSVTALPTVPRGYSVTVEQYAAYGVRLVVTAPRVAKLGSVNINFAGGRGNKTNETASRVSDNVAYSTLDHGAQPIVGTAWNDLEAKNATQTATRIVGADGVVANTGAVSVVTTQVNNPYTTDVSGGDRILFGYLDDGGNPKIVMSGIPFAKYRLIVYRATDQSNSHFSTVRMGADADHLRCCFGATREQNVAAATLTGESLVAWGDSDIRGELKEGVNYVVSEVLTGGGAVIESPKHSGRAGVAAVQIVEVGAIVDVDAVDYSATVTGTVNWDQGAGEGLLASGAWSNHELSTITLAGVEGTTSKLVFNTPVTSEYIRVTGTAPLALTGTAGVPFEVGRLDVTAARGCVSIEGLPSALPLQVAAGSWVRFADAGRNFAAPPITTTGAIVSYASATVGQSAEKEYSILRVENGDQVTYNLTTSGLVQPLDVRGGELTMTVPSKPAVLYYGGVGGVSASNSVITVSGGTLNAVTTGQGTSNQDCGFLFGMTYSASPTPAIVVTDGTFNLGEGQFAFWEKSLLTVGGNGTCRAWGFAKCAGGDSVLTLKENGRLEVGAGGIGKRLGNGTLAFNCAGGTLYATANAAVNLAPAVTGRTTLAAVAGSTLTLAAGASGTGTLVALGGDGQGTVRLTGGSYAAMTLAGRFSLVLTAEQLAVSEGEVALFKVEEGFDTTAVTVESESGVRATGGYLRVEEGVAKWKLGTAAVPVPLTDCTVYVPHAWLEDYGIRPEQLTMAPNMQGANGAPVWFSYLFGLNPTTEGKVLLSSIKVSNGQLVLDMPGLAAAVPVEGVNVRYVLETRESLEAEWQTHSTSTVPQLVLPLPELPMSFYRFRVEFDLE